MRFLLLTLLHNTTPQRTALSEKVLSYYADLDLDLDLVAVGTGTLDERLARENGFSFLQCPNDGIARRWQQGCISTRERDYDALIAVPSDDLVSHDWFMVAAAAVSGGYDRVSPASCYVYDWQRCRLVYLTHLLGLDAGRVLSRALLERAAYKAWDFEHSRQPVAAQNKALAPYIHREVTIDPREYDLPIVDIKCGDNINSFERLSKKTAMADVDDEILYRHFPGFTWPVSHANT